MTEKTTAKTELAELAKTVESGLSLCNSVNEYLQRIMMRVFGSITALGNDAIAKDDYIKAIGKTLKENKVACKYKAQMFDFMQYEGGIHKDENGHWRITSNNMVVDACKRAKTEAFISYVSEKKKAEAAKEKEAKAKADAELSAEEYMLKLLTDTVTDCANKAKKAKDSASKGRWEARAAYIEAVVKLRSSNSAA